MYPVLVVGKVVKLGRFALFGRSKSAFFEKRMKKNGLMLADNKINRIFADLLR